MFSKWSSYHTLRSDKGPHYHTLDETGFLYGLDPQLMPVKKCFGVTEEAVT